MRKPSVRQSEDQEARLERRAKFAVGLWLRVCAGAVFLAFLTPFSVLGWDFPYAKCAPAFVGLVALVVVNGAYWKVGEWRDFPVGDFYVHWAVDLVLITTILYGLGGARLPSAITAYMLIVITSAVFISRKASVLVATGGAIAYAGLVAGEAYGIVDPEYELDFERLSVGLRIFLVASPVFMLYLVAYIAGTLGNDLNAANKELSEKNRELAQRNEQLNRVRGELDFQSRVLTHDIRSPVSAAISTLSRLLVENDSDVGVSGDWARLALENLHRVEDMVHALNVARESGEYPNEREWVDVAQLVREVQVECQYAVDAKHARIIVANDLPRMWAVQGKIVVILRNLITNAIRYIKGDGRGEIQIGVVETEDEWRMFVRDNGTGVPLELQDNIFGLFRKGREEDESSGMGVGLALVRRAAMQHGGAAWVESDGENGATFWVRLPRVASFVETGSEPEGWIGGIRAKRQA